MGGDQDKGGQNNKPRPAPAPSPGRIWEDRGGVTKTTDWDKIPPPPQPPSKNKDKT